MPLSSASRLAFLSGFAVVTMPKMLTYLHIPLIAAISFGGAPGPAADFAPARRALEDAIAEKAFPGCSVAVGNHEGVLWKEGLGKLDYEDGPGVTTRTLYDLASLTKVVGTTTVVLWLVSEGRMTLEAPIATYVPELIGGGKDRNRITVTHLLTHSAGLPAWEPLSETRKGYAQVLAGVLETELESPPGAVERYSDLGFMLLGEAASRAGGASLAELEARLVFGPLGLRDTIRNPPESERFRIAPTEVRPQGPGQSPSPTRGTVHDENAAAAGGGTGHAGLFSTAEDLAVFALEMLRAARGESTVIPAAVAKQFFQRRNLVPGSSRALGWDTPSGQSSAGSLLGPESFGHTGFTGTSIWIDPKRDLFIVLLSNRVHPSRANMKISEVRRKLADRVVLCLEGRLRRL